MSTGRHRKSRARFLRRWMSVSGLEITLMILFGTLGVLMVLAVHAIGRKTA